MALNTDHDLRPYSAVSAANTLVATPHDHANDIHSIPNPGALIVEPPHPDASKVHDASSVPDPQKEAWASGKKGAAFWLVFLALCFATFLSALELTSVGTALPTIVEALHGKEYVWVGSAYSLASTAFLPASGGLASIFGRRPVMLISLVIFGVGAAVCGAAKSMGMLIAGRTVQGLGSGGILALSEIIVADLVPLRERGKYGGIIGAVWALASVLGPIVGGALAGAGQWRWLFYLNLPLTAVAFVLVMVFLNLKTPSDSLGEKLKRMDWTGIALSSGATTLAILALTWGGQKYSWGSYQVLLPLIFGLVGLGVFLFWEAKYAKSEAVIPWRLITRSKTSTSAYIATFIHGMAVSTVIYYLPTYFQAAHEAGPTESGVDLFGEAFLIAPAAVAVGVSVEITGRYVSQNYGSWIFMIVGCGLLSILSSTSSRGMAIGLEIISGIGFGGLYPAINFAVLAPMPIEDNAYALALFTFMRAFGQTWGITIGSTILQNRLFKTLPSAFLALPELQNAGAELSYAIIPAIPSLPEPIRGQVKSAFAESLKAVWWADVGLGVLGLLTCFWMRDIKLHVVTDEEWGFEKKEGVVEGEGEKA